jgi:hypothetical protein
MRVVRAVSRCHDLAALLRRRVGLQRDIRFREGHVECQEPTDGAPSQGEGSTSHASWVGKFFQQLNHVLVSLNVWPLKLQWCPSSDIARFLQANLAWV